MGAGRPTKFKEEYIEQAYDLCADGGFTDKNLATFFKVAESTINLWKLEHSEFSESIKKGKDKFDTEKVEKSLLKQAIGYKAKEKHITEEVLICEDCGKKTIKKTTRKVEKFIVVTLATIFWLKNRNPERWREEKHVVTNNHEDWLKLLEGKD